MKSSFMRFTQLIEPMCVLWQHGIGSVRTAASHCLILVFGKRWPFQHRKVFTSKFCVAEKKTENQPTCRHHVIPSPIVYTQLNFGRYIHLTQIEHLLEVRTVPMYFAIYKSLSQLISFIKFFNSVRFFFIYIKYKLKAVDKTRQHWSVTLSRSLSSSFFHTEYLRTKLQNEMRHLFLLWFFFGL